MDDSGSTRDREPDVAAVQPLAGTEANHDQMPEVLPSGHGDATVTGSSSRTRARQDGDSLFVVRQQSDLPEQAANCLPPYCAFFGLSRVPFTSAAATYWSRQHKKILAELSHGISNRRGLAVLTGAAGTGKTALLIHLGDRLVQESVEFGWIQGSRLGRRQLYESLAEDLRLPYEGRSKEEVLRSLTSLLRKEADRGSTTVLIVDDAQDLDQGVLSEIRLLDDLENRQGRLLQIVLAGSPELERRLGADRLDGLGQRVAVRRALRPLGEQETLEYIEDRMANAGTEAERVFPRPVLLEIHRRSGGILRDINSIGERLLERCFSISTTTATVDLLDSIWADLPGEHSASFIPPPCSAGPQRE
jgi:general secretion pathway protein A